MPKKGHRIKVLAGPQVLVVHATLARPASEEVPLREVEEISDGERPEIYTALAHALHVTGDGAAAVKMQRKALELLQPDDKRRTVFEQWITEYQTKP